MDREVREIPHDDASPFFMRVHYARALPQMKYTYGLFIDGKLSGVVSYGIPASPPLCKGLAGIEEFHNILELNRLVICDPTPNNASYLVSHSLKMLPRHTYVVSYADWGAWGHVGYIYQATNFLYTGKTVDRTDAKSDGKHIRSVYGKKKEERNIDYSKRQARSVKHRYVYVCASSKKEKKEMIAKLNYPVMPYPKGESRRYDTDDPHSLMPETERQQKRVVELQGNLFFDNVLFG